MTTQPAPIYFGAAYYPEYLTSDCLDDDMRLMRAAGFSVIRVGESTWSTWEPQDGRFDLDWLEPTLDAAHANGIAVVLGTPTYAVPPWLQRLHPEIAAEPVTGQPLPWGARQEMDQSHPTYRRYAERVIRAVVGRYCRHPAVVGYQVDNEPGLVLPRNRHVFLGFVADLRRQFGDVEALNRAWGLTYWSHRLSTWDDLWTPDGNTTPSYDLAWRRYQARLTSEFIAWQAGIVREYARGDQFVTTCIDLGRPGVDDPDLAAGLDTASVNIYYSTQDALGLPPRPGTAQGWSLADVPTLVGALDRAWAAKQAPFFVTETNASTIGGPDLNYPAYDGQWRQVAWAMIARGARMVEYWHWHCLPWGAETYWTGVLPHDRRPGRVYGQIAALGRELAAASPTLTGLVPDARVGLVWSNASRWALDCQPPFADEASPNGTYGRVVRAFQRGAFDAGLPVRVLHDTQIGALDPVAVATALPVMLAPALYVVDDPLIAWLRDYVAAGGHLVLGPRTACADPRACVREAVQPAGLADLAGCAYQEINNIDSPLRVTTVGEALPLPKFTTAERWIDGLLPDDPADALATYDHPHFAQFAAVVSHHAGAGRVTTVGCVPNSVLASAVVAWAVGADADSWRALSAGSVTVMSAGVASGRLHVVHNWSWTPAHIVLPEPAHDLANGASLAAGKRVDLGAWDVRPLLVAG
jgi:beta-galactosidase